RQMARHWKQRDTERSRRDLSKDHPVKTVERGRPSSEGFAANGRRRSVADPLLQAAFIKFDQIEIRLNIVATLASRFFEKMEKARPFLRRFPVAWKSPPHSIVRLLRANVSLRFHGSSLRLRHHHPGYSQRLQM